MKIVWTSRAWSDLPRLYEIRYEIKGDLIVITRLWHTRQHR